MFVKAEYNFDPTHFALGVPLWGYPGENREALNRLPEFPE